MLSVALADTIKNNFLGDHLPIKNGSKRKYDAYEQKLLQRKDVTSHFVITVALCNT